MRQLCIALICLGPVAASAQSTWPANKPYEYQDNVLGVTTYAQFADQMKTKGMAVDCSSAAATLKECDVDGSVNEHYFFVDDRLAMVTFLFNDLTSLDGYVRGLTAKFGEPVQSVATYENSTGASYSGRVWKWTNSQGRITVEERGDVLGGNIYIGHLFYGDTRLADEYNRRRNPAPSL